NRLREWEKKGLIRPIRLPSGHRRYPTEEIDRILKAGGMNETEADAVALYARVSTKKRPTRETSISSWKGFGLTPGRKDTGWWPNTRTWPPA
ncbi:MerR family transcriptional regulator, partial [Hydrogenibacillus schlegelii]|uniref:MerR family transcriptional regulator n=1 Tax=Hydrogenibacillus schlegelii TaxID=1484 RepID=UPI0034A0820D